MVMGRSPGAPICASAACVANSAADVISAAKRFIETLLFVQNGSEQQ
jgi:hypothetical protein